MAIIRSPLCLAGTVSLHQEKKETNEIRSNKETL